MQITNKIRTFRILNLWRNVPFNVYDIYNFKENFIVNYKNS